ncbi:MAG TPA: N-acetylmuramoyl-L-alanine amidase, partial [Acidobacteriota bacterium]|nr:N-acetylmuramoyl-L-alanine amidase [Acidobacteriota bacterium]
VFALYDPFRIVIDTRGPTRESASTTPEGEGESASSGQPSSSPSGTAPLPGSGAAPAPTANGDWTLTRTLGLKVGKVVIDPGHGGKDTGTIGPSGLREKDLVLSVALKLRDLLEDRLNTEVILTRDSDRFIPLEERTAIANQQGADLFISVHANASRNRKASGIETYILSFATSDAEREVASRENASSQRNIRELEDLLKKIAMEDFNQESRDLAHAVQTELFSELLQERPRQKNRGIKQAPFIVLIGSNMPSILTEIGFISNPDDETYYRSAEAHDQVAEALYKGVESYFRSLGTLPAAGPVSAATGR